MLSNILLLLHGKTFLAGHDAYYWIQVFLLIIFPLVRNMCNANTVDATQCPTTRLSWEKRAKDVDFTCKTDQNFVYHCILDNSGRLVETCAARVPVPQGKVGCPRIHILNGVAIHLDDNSECPKGNDCCPSGNNAYFSDQLYLYPICLLNVSERHYAPKKCQFFLDSTEKKDSNINDTAEDNHLTAIIIILVIICVALAISNGLTIYRFWRKKPKPKERDADLTISLENGSARKGEGDSLKHQVKKHSNGIC